MNSFAGSAASGPEMSEEPRYHLTDVAGGSLLLDLESGSLMELNLSAALVWRLHLAGKSSHAIACELSDRYGLDQATAASHVQGALIPPLGSLERPPTDFDYANVPSGYLFSFREQPVFLVDHEGKELRLPEQTEIPPALLTSVLHALAPKILALRGHVVLHAAAVEIDKRVIAFSGLSGAGKSTTAGALVSAGARSVCEDQMVVRVDGSTVTVALSGERTTSTWIHDAASSLIATREARCEGLDRVQEGERARLVEIGFIDEQRRTPEGYRFSPLSGASTAGAIFRNVFYGADTRVHWKRAVDTAAAIGGDVSGMELTLPDSLQRLGDLGRKLVDIGSLKAQ